MSDSLLPREAERLHLQIQYANAVYQVARFKREAEISKHLLDQMAEKEAESKFGVMQVAPKALAGEGE